MMSKEFNQSCLALPGTSLGLFSDMLPDLAKLLDHLCASTEIHFCLLHPCTTHAETLSI